MHGVAVLTFEPVVAQRAQCGEYDPCLEIAGRHREPRSVWQIVGAPSDDERPRAAKTRLHHMIGIFEVERGLRRMKLDSDRNVHVAGRKDRQDVLVTENTLPYGFICHMPRVIRLAFGIGEIELVVIRKQHSLEYLRHRWHPWMLDTLNIAAKNDIRLIE
jgi:hypothetical protein